MANSVVRGLQADLELIIGTNTTGETIENLSGGLLTIVNAVNQVDGIKETMVEDTVVAVLNPGEIHTLLVDEALYIRDQRVGATSTVTQFRILAL